MLKGMQMIEFYWKIGRQILKGDTVDQLDYQHAYNQVAPTYDRWLQKMGKYTDRIIRPECFPVNRELKILDLACGTGYISKQLLEYHHVDAVITAVDISENMLNQMYPLAKDKIKQINQDGIAFLKETNESYDVIFCGWALPYFDYNQLLELCGKRLKPDGIMAVISNSQGTLDGIESVFLKTMHQHQEAINKPMNIHFKLVKDKGTLTKWFVKHGFTPLEVGEDDVRFSFDSPEGLYNWIMSTGAVAGTREIFHQYDRVEEAVIQGIGKATYHEGRYYINHKFVYGIFRYKPSTEVH